MIGGGEPLRLNVERPVSMRDRLEVGRLSWAVEGGRKVATTEGLS